MRKRRVEAPAGSLTAGNIESLGPAHISGWASGSIDGDPIQFPEVRVIGDSPGTPPLASGRANGYRPDVLAAGHPSAWCGFDLQLIDGQPHFENVTLQLRVQDMWVDVATASFPEITTNTTVATSEWKLAELARPFFDRGLTVVSLSEQHEWLSDEIEVITPHVEDLNATVQAIVQKIGGGEPEQRLVFKGKGGASVAALGIRLRLRRPTSSHSAKTVRLGVQGVGLGWDFEAVLHADGTRRHIDLFRPGQDDHVSVLFAVPSASPVSATPDADQDVWVEVIGHNFDSLTVGPLTSVTSNPDQPECLKLRGHLDLLLQPQAQGRGDEFDEDYSVVVPFYGAHSYLDNSLVSLSETATGRVHLVLIDDGSPRGSKRWPGEPAGFASVKMIRFPTNRGYTAAVNAGVTASDTGKVVILNSDTRTLPGWNEPLLMALDIPDIFASGPLSNAASHQSIPMQLHEGQWVVNEYAAAVRPAELALGLLEEFGRNFFTWDIPNGFCYAVRRADFLELGSLDEAAFPRGYGEEVDLMLRALAAGYRNVICPGSFVYHYKSRTFRSDREVLVKAGIRTVGERWGGALDVASRRMAENVDMAHARAAASARVDKLGGGKRNA